MKFLVHLFLTTICFYCAPGDAKYGDLDGIIVRLGPITSAKSSPTSEKENETLTLVSSNISSEVKLPFDNITSETTITSPSTVPAIEDELTRIFSSSTKEEHHSSSGNFSTPPTLSASSKNNGLDSTTHVVLDGEKPIIFPKTLIQKTIDWLNDTYTLSIALPIAAGVVFASTIIMTIWVCNCCRRRCRRRRLRRKILPDTVKNMRPSDRARLLAESSDEEF